MAPPQGSVSETDGATCWHTGTPCSVCHAPLLRVLHITAVRCVLAHKKRLQGRDYLLLVQVTLFIGLHVLLRLP